MGSDSELDCDYSYTFKKTNGRLELKKNLNIGKDMNIICDVLKNQNKYISEYKIDQEMVLNKVNLVKNIERIFD